MGKDSDLRARRHVSAPRRMCSTKATMPDMLFTRGVGCWTVLFRILS